MRDNVDMKATLSTLARWTPFQSGVRYKRVKPCKTRGKSLGNTPQKLWLPLLLRRSRHLVLSAEAGAMFVSALLFFFFSLPVFERLHATALRKGAALVALVRHKAYSSAVERTNNKRGKLAERPTRLPAHPFRVKRGKGGHGWVNSSV